MPRFDDWGFFPVTFRNYKDRSCPKQKLKTCSVLLTIVQFELLVQLLQKRSAQQLSCLVRALKGITPCQKWNRILLNWWNLLWHQETVCFQMVWTRKSQNKSNNCVIFIRLCPTTSNGTPNPNFDFVFGGVKLQAEQEQTYRTSKKNSHVFSFNFTPPPKINGERHLIQKKIFIHLHSWGFHVNFSRVYISWLAKHLSSVRTEEAAPLSWTAWDGGDPGEIRLKVVQPESVDYDIFVYLYLYIHTTCIMYTLSYRCR